MDLSFRSMFGFGAVALISAAALSVDARAAAIDLTIDFTRSTQLAAPESTGTVALNGSNTPQRFGVSGLDFGPLGITASWTPANLSANADGVNGLPSEFAANIDGFGIGDDEITGGSSSQSLTLAFDRPVWIDSIFALDVFKAPDGGNGERVTVSLANSVTGDAGVFRFGYDGTAIFGNFDGTVDGNPLAIDFLGDSSAATAVTVLTENRGLLQLTTQPSDHLFRIFQATTLTFTAEGSSQNDYALAGLTVADVSAVPVPAALPLLAAALGAIGYASRRRKRLIA